MFFSIGTDANEIPPSLLKQRTHGPMGIWVHGPMGIWVHGCMGVWVHGSMGVYGCMGPWVYGCVGPWVHGCMGPWVHGCMGPWVSKTLYTFFPFVFDVNSQWWGKWGREGTQRNVPELKQERSHGESKGTNFSCGFSYCARFVSCGSPMFRLEDFLFSKFSEVNCTVPRVKIGDPPPPIKISAAMKMKM